MLLALVEISLVDVGICVLIDAVTMPQVILKIAVVAFTRKPHKQTLAMSFTSYKISNVFVAVWEDEDAETMHLTIFELALVLGPVGPSVASAM